MKRLIAIILVLLSISAPASVDPGETLCFGTGDRLIGKASAYCGCEACCGKSDRITASGKTACEGGCACNWLPFGTVIEFCGKRYTVNDRGSSERFDVIGRIDIYFDSHEDALAFGVQTGVIEIISSEPF